MAASEQSRRVGPLVWALAAVLLLVGVGIYVVLYAEPALVGTQDVIAVPETSAPTPLMKPK